MKTNLIAVAVVLLGFSSSALAVDLNRLLSVKGIICEACPPQVERELRKVQGVRAANIDLKSGQAEVGG